MKAKKVFIREKIITFISLVSLISFIFPQVAIAETKEKTETYSTNLDYFSETANNLNQGLPEIEYREPKKTINLTVTAYSSSPDECSGNPFITASGEHVKDGTVAHNYLPFGTKVRFPEVFGNKIFTVEDRLAPHKGYYLVDIWLPSKQEAKEWGVKTLKMEIL